MHAFPRMKCYGDLMDTLLKYFNGSAIGRNGGVGRGREHVETATTGRGFGRTVNWLSIQCYWLPVAPGE